MLVLGMLVLYSFIVLHVLWNKLISYPLSNYDHGLMDKRL